jgi:hypothetical protein
VVVKRVFVVQNQHRWNKELGRFEPKYDLSPAAAHGEIIDLLSPTAAPFNSRPIIEELRRKLEDFGPGDCLLLIGNPVLIGVAVAIAACSNGGDVDVLQWSGKEGRYLRVALSGLITF